MRMEQDRHGERFIKQRITSVQNILNGLIGIGLLSPQLLGGEVIDLGAWAGGSTQALRSFGGRVTAVEQSQAQLNKGIAKKRIESKNAILAKVEDYLAARQEPVDIIAFFGITEGVDIEAAFTHSQRILKPNGKFILTCMNQWEYKIDSLLIKGGKNSIRKILMSGIK